MSKTLSNKLQHRGHPKTEAERKAWIRRKQATAELRNIKRRMKAGRAKPTDINRTKELELITT